MNIFLRYFGYILILSGSFRLFPIIAALYYGEPTLGFIVSGLVSVFLGICCVYADRKDVFSIVQTLSLSHAFMLVAASFIIIPITGSLSYLSTFNYNIVNALFESVSGYTTTGLSMIVHFDSVPKSLLLWRALTQWIGGVGIVLMLVYIVSRLTGNGSDEQTQMDSTSALYQTQGLSQRMETNLLRSTKSILFLYLGYTFLGIFGLFFSGMELFEATSLTFAAISTGGFGVRDSLDITGLQMFILALLMLVGATSFISHHALLRRNWRKFYYNPELWVFVCAILVSSFLVVLQYPNVYIALFEIISAFTTTGFSLSTVGALPPAFAGLIVVGMLVGGTVVSTSGGIKVSRVMSLIRMIPWTLKKLASPRHAVIPLKVYGAVVEMKDQILIAVFVSTYVCVLLMGMLVFLLLGYGFFDSFFQIASALGTVGLSSVDMVTIPVIGKIVLMVAMVLGRVEIFPVLLLVRSFFLRMTR